jgi:general secretion pathway protein K
LKVKGFTEDVFKKIKPHLTLVGSEKINVNTAGPEVLMSLSSEMTEETASYIVDYRKGSPFEKVSDVKEVSGLAENIYFSMKSSLAVKSNFFRIHSLAIVNDAGKRIQAVIQKDNNSLLSFKVE